MPPAPYEGDIDHPMFAMPNRMIESERHGREYSAAAGGNGEGEKPRGLRRSRAAGI